MSGVAHVMSAGAPVLEFESNTEQVEQTAERCPGEPLPPPSQAAGVEARGPGQQAAKQAEQQPEQKLLQHDGNNAVAHCRHHDHVMHAAIVVVVVVVA